MSGFYCGHALGDPVSELFCQCFSSVSLSNCVVYPKSVSRSYSPGSPLGEGIPASTAGSAPLATSGVPQLCSIKKPKRERSGGRSSIIIGAKT